jgi:hypothetical protein
MGPARAVALLLAVVVAVFILVMVAFPYALLVRIMEYNARFVTFRKKRAALSEAYDRLKTGDILLFVSASHMPTSSGVTQTFFTHAAVLVREGDLVYTSEAQLGTELMPCRAAPGGERRMPEGAGVAPLLTRLKFYTGSFYLMRLARPLPPGAEEALKAEADRLSRAGYPYPSFLQAAVATLTGRPAPARHCFAHVAHLLDRAGLTPLDRDGAPFAEAGFLRVCREVCDLPGRPLQGGNFYEEPVQLLYDLDTVPLGGSGGPDPDI